MGATKDFEMSPFEAARKLLSLEAQHLSLGQQSDLIFQDMDLVPLLIQENYLNHRPIISQSDASRMQVDCQLHIMLVGLFTYVLLSDKYHSFNVTILWNTVLVEMRAMYAQCSNTCTRLAAHNLPVVENSPDRNSSKRCTSRLSDENCCMYVAHVVFMSV